LQIYKELRNLKRKKVTGLDNFPPGLLKDAASVIAKPLTYIINLSLRSGAVPAEWKEAKVLPLFKSGSSTEIGNYRPISLLPILLKILEKVVYSQLVSYLESHNLLPDNQFGFRSKRSTELAVTYFTDIIRKEADNGTRVTEQFLLVVDTRSVETTIRMGQNMLMCHSLRCKQIDMSTADRSDNARSHFSLREFGSTCVCSHN